MSDISICEEARPHYKYETKRKNKTWDGEPYKVDDPDFYNPKENGLKAFTKSQNKQQRGKLTNEEKSDIKEGFVKLKNQNGKANAVKQLAKNFHVHDSVIYKLIKGL